MVSHGSAHSAQATLKNRESGVEAVLPRGTNVASQGLYSSIGLILKSAQ